MNTDKQAQLILLFVDFAVIRRGFSYVDTDEGRAPIGAAMNNKEKEINELAAQMTEEELCEVHMKFESLDGGYGGSRLACDFIGKILRKR